MILKIVKNFIKNMIFFNIFIKINKELVGMRPSNFVNKIDEFLIISTIKDLLKYSRFLRYC
jgi:hypothetical protein